MELPTLACVHERELAQDTHVKIVHTTHPKCERRLFKSLYAVSRVKGLGEDLVRPELHSPWRYSTHLQHDSSNVKSE